MKVSSLAGIEVRFKDERPTVERVEPGPGGERWLQSLEGALVLRPRRGPAFDLSGEALLLLTEWTRCVRTVAEGDSEEGRLYGADGLVEVTRSGARIMVTCGRPSASQGQVPGETSTDTVARYRLSAHPLLAATLQCVSSLLEEWLQANPRLRHCGPIQSLLFEAQTLQKHLEERPHRASFGAALAAPFHALRESPQHLAARLTPALAVVVAVQAIALIMMWHRLGAVTPKTGEWQSPRIARGRVAGGLEVARKREPAVAREPSSVSQSKAEPASPPRTSRAEESSRSKSQPSGLLLPVQPQFAVPPPAWPPADVNAPGRWQTPGGRGQGTGVREQSAAPMFKLVGVVDYDGELTAVLDDGVTTHFKHKGELVARTGTPQSEWKVTAVSEDRVELVLVRRAGKGGIAPHGERLVLAIQ